MTATERGAASTQAPQERCDIRVWSGECRQEEYATDGEKYLCTTCGTIKSLDHEMRHEVFPYISGDTDNLS